MTLVSEETVGNLLNSVKKGTTTPQSVTKPDITGSTNIQTGAIQSNNITTGSTVNIGDLNGHSIQSSIRTAYNSNNDTLKKLSKDVLGDRVSSFIKKLGESEFVQYIGGDNVDGVNSFIRDLGATVSALSQRPPKAIQGLASALELMGKKPEKLQEFANYSASIITPATSEGNKFVDYEPGTYNSNWEEIEHGFLASLYQIEQSLPAMFLGSKIKNPLRGGVAIASMLAPGMVGDEIVNLSNDEKLNLTDKEILTKGTVAGSINAVIEGFADEFFIRIFGLNGAVAVRNTLPMLLGKKILDVGVEGATEYLQDLVSNAIKDGLQWSDFVEAASVIVPTLITSSLVPTTVLSYRGAKKTNAANIIKGTIQEALDNTNIDDKEAKKKAIKGMEKIGREDVKKAAETLGMSEQQGNQLADELSIARGEYDEVDIENNKGLRDAVNTLTDIDNRLKEIEQLEKNLEDKIDGGEKSIYTEEKGVLEEIKKDIENDYPGLYNYVNNRGTKKDASVSESTDSFDVLTKEKEDNDYVITEGKEDINRKLMALESMVDRGPDPSLMETRENLKSKNKDYLEDKSGLEQAIEDMKQSRSRGEFRKAKANVAKARTKLLKAINKLNKEALDTWGNYGYSKDRILINNCDIVLKNMKPGEFNQDSVAKFKSRLIYLSTIFGIDFNKAFEGANIIFRDNGGKRNISGGGEILGSEKMIWIGGKAQVVINYNWGKGGDSTLIHEIIHALDELVQAKTVESDISLFTKEELKIMNSFRKSSNPLFQTYLELPYEMLSRGMQQYDPTMNFEGKVGYWSRTEYDKNIRPIIEKKLNKIKEVLGCELKGDSTSSVVSLINTMTNGDVFEMYKQISDVLDEIDRLNKEFDDITKGGILGIQKDVDSYNRAISDIKDFLGSLSKGIDETKQSNEEYIAEKKKELNDRLSNLTTELNLLKLKRNVKGYKSKNLSKEKLKEIDSILDSVVYKSEGDWINDPDSGLYKDHMYAYKIWKLQEQEGRIGKVGNKKVGAEYSYKQSSKWTEERESIIRSIRDDYNLDQFAASAKFDELENASYEFIQERETKKKEKYNAYGEKELTTEELQYIIDVVEDQGLIAQIEYVSNLIKEARKELKSIKGKEEFISTINDLNYNIDECRVYKDTLNLLSSLRKSIKPELLERRIQIKEQLSDAYGRYNILISCGDMFSRLTKVMSDMELQFKGMFEGLEEQMQTEDEDAKQRMERREGQLMDIDGEALLDLVNMNKDKIKRESNKNLLKKFGRLSKTYFRGLFDRLFEIDPRLGTMMLKYEGGQMLEKAHLIRVNSGFIKRMKDSRENNHQAYMTIWNMLQDLGESGRTTYVKKIEVNGKKETIQGDSERDLALKIASKFGIENYIAQVIDSINYIGERARKAGVKTNIKDNYYPRQVRDPEGLRAYIKDKIANGLGDKSYKESKDKEFIDRLSDILTHNEIVDAQYEEKVNAILSDDGLSKDKKQSKLEELQKKYMEMKWSEQDTVKHITDLFSNIRTVTSEQEKIRQDSLNYMKRSISTTEAWGNEIIQFYRDPIDALDTFLQQSLRTIYKAEMFGKGVGSKLKRVEDLIKGYNLSGTQEKKVIDSFVEYFAGRKSKTDLREEIQIYHNKSQELAGKEGFLTKDEFDDLFDKASEIYVSANEFSIGGVINQIEKERHLTDDELIEIQNLIDSYFSDERYTTLDSRNEIEVLSSVKNLSTIITLGQIQSTITQLGDAAHIINKLGYVKGFKTLYNSFFRKTGIPAQELGLEDSFDELREARGNEGIYKLGKALFKITGFRKFDIGMKRGIGQAHFENLIDMYNAGGKKRDMLMWRLNRMYSKEMVEQILGCIKEGNPYGIIDNGVFIDTKDINSALALDIMYAIGQVQPIFKSSMPTAYINNTVVKLLFALKSFTLNIDNYAITETKNVYDMYKYLGYTDKESAVRAGAWLSKTFGNIILFELTTNSIKNIVYNAFKAIGSGDDYEEVFDDSVLFKMFTGDERGQTLLNNLLGTTLSFLFLNRFKLPRLDFSVNILPLGLVSDFIKLIAGLIEVATSGGEEGLTKIVSISDNIPVIGRYVKAVLEGATE